MLIAHGTITKYAKGITVTQFGGKRVIEHGGGINGFLSQNSYFPDDNMSIVVLVNSTGPVSPGQTEKNIAEFIFKKTEEGAPLKYDGDLSSFGGTYKGRGRGQDLVIQVTHNDSTILVQLGDDKPSAMKFRGDNAWANDHATFYFNGASGKLDELRVDEVYNFYILKKDK